MDFGTLLQTAKKNENQKKEVRYYNTKFSPPKKEEKKAKNLSANIQKFLAKKEAEEKQKMLEAKQKREELLALRSQDKKATRRVNVMLKRTKSANQSVIEDAVDKDNTAVTLAGPSQPDEDDYGYVSQEAAAFYNKMMEKYSKIPDDPKFPTSRKKASSNLNSTKDRVKAALEREKEEALLPHKRKRKHHDQEHEARYEEVEEEQSSSPPPARVKPKSNAPPPLNFTDLLKLAEQKQFEPIVVEVKPKDDEGPLMTKKQKREHEKMQQLKEAQKKRNSEKPNPEKSENRIPKVFNSERSENRIPKISSSERSENRIPKISNPERADNRIQKLSASTPVNSHKIKANGSYHVPSSKSSIPNNKSASVVDKLNNNNVIKSSAHSAKPREKDIAQRNPIQKSSSSKSEIPSGRLDSIRQKLPPSNSLSKKKPEVVNMTPAKKPFQPLKDHQSSSDRRILNSKPALGNSSGQLSSKPITKLNGQNNIPKKSSSVLNGSKESLKSKAPAMREKEAPSKNIQQTKKLPLSGDLKPKQFPPRDLKPKQFPPTDLKPKQFPPADLKPKQFPPPDVQRFPPKDVKRKAPISNKRRIMYDDEEEYDSEMDDFIDDGPEGEDYSKYIKEIFGYDKSKYRGCDEDDVDNMESSFAQQMREDIRSTKIGIMEDLEDIKREKEEKRAKALMKKRRIL